MPDCCLKPRSAPPTRARSRSKRWSWSSADSPPRFKWVRTTPTRPAYPSTCPSSHPRSTAASGLRRRTLSWPWRRRAHHASAWSTRSRRPSISCFWRRIATVCCKKPMRRPRPTSASSTSASRWGASASTTVSAPMCRCAASSRDSSRRVMVWRWRVCNCVCCSGWLANPSSLPAAVWRIMNRP